LSLIVVPTAVKVRSAGPGVQLGEDPPGLLQVAIPSACPPPLRAGA